MTTQTLDTGLYWVKAPCPRCGEVALIPVQLSSVLTVPEGDDPPTIKVRARSKAEDHACGQTSLPAGLFGVTVTRNTDTDGDRERPGRDGSDR